MIGLLRKSGSETVRTGIVWIMMLATVMAVEVRWIKCDLWIFYVIPALMLLGVVSTICRKTRFQLSISDVIAITWFAYYLGRTWVGNEWSCRIEFLKTTELFLLYAGLRVAFDRTKISAWIIIGSILTLGCYEAWIGALQIYGIETSRNSLYALTGSFMNPGPYSAYLMIGIVVGLSSLKEIPCQPVIKNIPVMTFSKIITERFPEKTNCLVRNVENLTWIHLVTVAVIVMALILPATWSRAAFVSISLITLWIFRQYYWKYRYLIWGILILIGCGFYFIKQGSADGRIIVWSASIATWLESPWLGVGIGGFRNAFAEGMLLLYERNVDLSSAGVTDNAYNILVKILVEQGIVGALIAITLCVSALIVLHKNSKPLFFGLSSLMLFSLFSYPFDILSYKIIAVVVFAWSESTNGWNICRLGRVKTALFSCLLVFLAWQTYKLAEESYEADKDYAMIRGFYDKSFIKDYYELLPLEGDNPQFLFDFGKTLRELKRYNDSNAMLRRGALCSADPMFHVLMGNNYRDMGHCNLAEQSYEKAFAIMPNRLYPLYQLMLMYRDNGNVEKARIMAERVLALKPKIESPATKEMKDIAKGIMHDKRGSRKSLIE